MTGQRPPTVLGFDYGLRRIGVAVGNVVTATAEPLLSLLATAGRPDWDALERCIADWRPGLAVVGVPYNMDGSPGALTEPALRFSQALRSRSLRLRGLLRSSGREIPAQFLTKEC